MIKNNSGSPQDAELRLWDGRGKIATGREQVWGGGGTPTNGTVNNQGSSSVNGVSSYPRSVPQKTIEINQGFEGDLTVNGLANPRPGETFSIISDGETLFTSNQQRVRFNLLIPSSNRTLTWGVTGNPLIIPNQGIGVTALRNSFLQITGIHRSWSGFLFFR